MAAYDAFISYSHAKDKPIAAALQSTVQTLGKAWYKRRSLRIFRDDTSLSATPHLWPTIEQALSETRFLILLASSEAAASMWVGKEVAYWLEHKSIDTLLIAVTDGDLAWDGAAGDFKWSAATPLPPVLKGRFPAEPKWVDLRPYREGASKRDVKFMELGADFAAAVHGIPKEDLLSQEVRQQRRALTLAWSAVGTLIVLGGLAAWQWKTAVDAQRLAEAQRQRAEQTLDAATGTANGMITNLAQRFRDVTGMPIALVRDVLEQAQGLQKQLLNRGETSFELRRGSAVALGSLSETMLIAGDTKAAIDAADTDRKILEGLLVAGPPTIRLDRDAPVLRADLAVAYRQLGLAFNSAGQREPALGAFGKSIEFAEMRTAVDPKDTNAQLILATSHEFTGDILAIEGNNEEALAEFGKALTFREQAAPATVAESYRRMAEASAALGRRQDALSMFQNAVAAAEKQVADKPTNSVVKDNLYLLYVKQAYALQDSGQAADALMTFQKAQVGFETLAASDSGNIVWRLEAAKIDSAIGDVLAVMGRYDDALAAQQKALPVLEKQALVDQADADLQHDLTVSYSSIAALLARAGKTEDAAALLQKSVAVGEKRVEADPRSSAWQHELATSYTELADALSELGQTDEAIADYQKSSTMLEKLTATNSGNVEWQHDLSVAYERVGLVLGATGKSEEALATFQKVVAIREKLADPRDPRVLKDLEDADNHVGDVSLDLGRPQDALQAYEKSLSVAVTIGNVDVNNPNWSRDVGNCYMKIASAQTALGQSEDALAAYRHAAGIGEKLAAANPRNAVLQSNLALTYDMIGALLADMGKFDDASADYQAAVRLKPASANDYLNRGRAQFFLGQAAAAADDFAKAFELNASYAYDLLWLHMARARAGQDDRQELAADAAKLSTPDWPRPLVALFLGSSSPEDIRAEARSAPDAKTQRDRVCEAAFYIGLYQLEKGDQGGAVRDLQLAAGECPAGFNERTGAQLELWRLRNPKDAPSFP